MHHAVSPARTYDWLNIIVIGVVHVVAAIGLVYTLWTGLAWQNVVLAVIWYWASGLSITGGYHRLFSHKSYRSAGILKLFYLLFGSAAVQNSAMNWASDHRRHHADTDAEGDPYDARQGLWWSHLGWVLHKDPDRDLANVPDLQRDRLVAFQHRYYVPLAVLMAGVVPPLVGLLWNDPLGAWFWAGNIRLVAQYHSTFSINSIAHKFGTQPYGSATSARDSGLVALITMGEGYHNFHHRFPGDYRNGVRAWHFDPTKWIVALLSKVGITRDLKRVSPVAIERAREEARQEST